MKELLCKVYVDMDDFKLPDYNYSLGALMEEGMDYDDAVKLIKEKFGADIENPDDDTTFEEPVSKEDLEKVKVDLVETLKRMVKAVIQEWEAGNIEELTIDDAIGDCASKLYTEIDDLGWDANVKILVEIDGKEEEIK